MTMESQIAAREGGVAEVVVRADVDVVGRIVQLGRGMIEQVSHQLFGQFAACVRATLEAEETARLAETPEAAAAARATVPAQPRHVHAFSLVFRALWAWILTLFRRPPHGARRA
jgi:hypothetical protein